VAAPVASGLANVARSTNVPPQLVGQWSRRVSLADLKRANTGVIPPVVPVGTACTITIKTSGALRLACTNLGKYNGLGCLEAQVTNAGNIPISRS